MTDQELEELKAGLDHCTPGPWVLEIETSEHVDESEEDRQPEVYVCSPATVCDYTVVATMGRAESIRHDRKSRDAAHIARCSPEAIRSLIARVEKAEGGWRPIETAEKTDEPRLVWSERGGHSIAYILWVADDGTDAWFNDDVVIHTPTHWRPLPPPPSPPGS